MNIYSFFLSKHKKKSIERILAQLCSHFIWKSSRCKGARISWNAICYPKAEGGLGLKDMMSWNQACMLQNIWALITRAGSLWIAWIKEYVLKGRSIWSISATRNSSWNWRKILQLRTLSGRFIEQKGGVEVWRIPGEKYSTIIVWQEIRQKQNKVSWHKLL